MHGTIIANRYRLKEYKGSGSFGEVWLAEDTLLGIEEAIKLYISLNQTGRDEFAEEYRVMCGLRHQNLLTPKHFDIWQSRPYLVMDYCAQGSAGNKVGQATEKEIWTFIRDVAGGLKYLHEQKPHIIHQDIKPENILMDKGGYLITDFGISKKMRATMRKQSNRKTSGALAYMAPECFLSEPLVVMAGDIFSLGVSVYELATGELPFMGQGGVMLNVGAELPKLSEDKWSADLNQVMRSCLSKDPWDRPTAEKLAELAQKKLNGERVAVQPKEQPAPPTPTVIIPPAPPKPSVPKPYTPPVPQPLQECQSKPRQEPPPLPKYMTWVWFWLVIVSVITFIPLIYSFESKHEDYTETVSDINFRMDMVYVEGGTFMMGATAEQGSDAYDNEKPTHRVTLDGYHMSKYEITQAQWKAVMGTTIEEQRDKQNQSWKLKGVGDNYPMYYVSWTEAKEFCDKLSQKTGKKYALPTEAQWEFAARGGNKSKGYKYSGSNTVWYVAWYKENSKQEANIVGEKGRNELGICDMSGNVWEWCADWYGPYSSDMVANPTGPDSGYKRVVRGGSWYYDVDHCRVSSRTDGGPDDRGVSIGFRVVCLP